MDFTTLCLIVIIMAIRVVDFSNGVYKIRKIFAKESTYSKEITGTPLLRRFLIGRISN